MRTLTAEKSERIDLLALLGAAKRQKWAILGALLASMGIAVAAFYLLPPKYTSVAWLLIEPIGLPEANVQGVQHRSSSGGATENEARYLTSRIVLEQVARELSLEKSPEFSETINQAGPSQAARDQALFEALAERVDVERTGQSEVLGVSVTTGSPELTASVANAIVNVYLNSRRAEKIKAVTSTIAWLQDRTARLREELTQAEQGIQEYRTRTALSTGASGVLVGEDLPRLRSDVAAARADAAEKGERLRRIMEYQAVGRGFKPVLDSAASPIIVNLLQQREELQRQETNLQTTFGDRHPAVQEVRAQRARTEQQMNTEVNNIIDNLRVEAGAAEARHRLLASVLTEAEQRTVTASQAEVRLRELEREAASRRAVYEATLLRLTDLQGHPDAIQQNARLLTEAGLPHDASFPKLPILLVAGGIGGLLAGLGVAALREHLDHTVRTAGQLEAALGIAAAGVLPRLEGRKMPGSAFKTLLNAPTSPFSEAARSLYARLLRLRPNTASRVLLITSSVQDEGKTTLSVALSSACALAGKRVILVEMDLRRPAIAREFGMAVETGMAEVLAGTAKACEAIQTHTPVPGLHVLPVRAPVANAPSFLSSPALGELLQALRGEYDEIILDAPPVLGISDVSFLAPMADSALFVVRWGRTTLELATSGLESVAGHGIPLAGAALTQVDLKDHEEYAYSYGYKALPSYPLSKTGPAPEISHAEHASS